MEKFADYDDQTGVGCAVRLALPTLQVVMHIVNLHGIPVHTVSSKAEIISALNERITNRKSMLLTFVNPYAWRIGEHAGEYAALLRRFDLILPDGIGVVKVLQWLHDRTAQRFSFDATSLYLPVFEMLDALGCSLFVVGAKPGVAERALQRMRREFPRIDYHGCRDGYRDWTMLCDEILARQPAVVLCGMGVPHQERFMLMLKDFGYSGIIISCGGFLDQLAEEARYYPEWIDKLDLRWAYRIYKEPRRLWRRYAIDYFPFIRSSANALARRWIFGTSLPLPVERSDLTN